MPFWWRRRRRPWFYNRRRYQRKYPTKRRKRRRRIYRRQRFRRPARRRRRRRQVRRKKKLITVKQWQPDSIVHCKIKGEGIAILGSQGKQLNCYTYTKEFYVPPKAPMGGGFSAEIFSLQYLYEEYKFHRNIWTKTNIFKDLCRYLRCSFTFFRHPETDFIVAYERQPPFPLDKVTYTSIHPQQMLLQRHRRLVLSTATNPKGRLKTKLRIKPPKQMITKWFFTHHFCSAPLAYIKATAANFRYSNLGCCNLSQQVNVYYLNLTFYKNTNWGHNIADTTPYIPYEGIPNQLTVTYKSGNTTKTETLQKPTTYAKSVAYQGGYFDWRILSATTIGTTTSTATTATSVCRYNPAADDGTQSKIYLVSIVKQSPIQPQDPVLVYQGLPIWLMLFGYLDYVLQTKKDKTFLNTYYMVLESPAFHIYSTTHTTPQIIPIDKTFIQGQAPYNEYVTDTMKTQWYPTIQKQLETLNALVTSGPYIPKYDQVRNSTWELDYYYCFHFKWGGPEITDQEVVNPVTLQEYDVPDHLQKTVQITNPSKQIPQSYLHPWDQRRGFITARALKRMSENIETDSDFYPDAEIPQKKKRITNQLRVQEEKTEEIQACLQELCKESTYQEATDTNLIQLINQQREQQFQLKRNLLMLLSEMKEKQRMLQLHTGLLE
nr:MAG: ORF1 [Torque teno midi virus]